MTTNSTTPTIPSTPAAVLCPLSGAYLMEASAGTGKTWTLTGILLRLLIQKNAAPDTMVATTFTRAAAQEIYERLNARLLDFAVLMDWLGANGELFGMSGDELAQTLALVPTTLGEQASVSKHLSDPLLRYLFDWVVAGGQERFIKTQKQLALAQLNLDKLFVGTLDALAQKWLGEFFDHDQDEEILSDTRTLTHALAHDALRQIKAKLYYEYSVLHALLENKVFEDLVALNQKLSSAFECLDVPVCHAPSLEDLTQEAQRLQQSIQDLAAADFSSFVPYLEMDYRTSQGMKKNDTLTKYFHCLPKLLSSLSVGIEGFFGLDNDSKKLLESFGKESIGSFNKNYQTQETAWRALDLQRLAQLFVLYERCLALKDGLKSAVIATLIEQVRQELPKLLSSQKKTSFFLKMHGLIQKLSAPSGKHIAQHIRHLYPVALIDEAQDLNHAQAHLLEQVYLTNKNPPAKQFLLVVGDPKQAIYRFRGADVANYLYLKGLGLDTSFCLNVNQRTHQILIEAMNAWFGEGFDDLGEAIAYEPVSARHKTAKYLGKPLTFLHLTDTKADRFELVVRHVCQRMSEGVPACDIAVLVAKNEDIHRLQGLFGQYNVPTKTSQSPSVFLSRACQDLAGVFLAILKPEPTRLLSALTGFFGYEFGVAQQILADDHKKSALLLYLSQIYEAWQNKGASFAFTVLMARHPIERVSVWESQACFVEASGYLSDLWQLFDILAGFDGTILAFLAYLEAQKTDKDHPIVRTDEVGVTISTMHKSKGLEFSVVYVLDLYKINQPNTQVYFYHEDHQRKLSVVPKKGEQDFAQQDKQETLDEKKRLGYVALTRAADQLYVVVQDLAQKSDNPMACWGFLPDGRHFVLPERLSSHADWLDADTLLDGLPTTLSTLDAPVVAMSDWQALYPKTVFDGVYRTSFSGLLYRLKAPSLQVPNLDLAANTNQALVVADYDESDLATESLPDSHNIRNSWRRGMVGGSFLHLALQRMAYRPPRLAVQDAVYETNLIVDNDSQDSIAVWLQQVLDEAFTASGAVYTQLGVRQHEFGFVLGDFADIKTADLVQVFNAHSAFGLQALSDPRSYGYLCGSIDLVYEHDGVFYVVDFKSNYLSDYTQDSMKHAMNQHHYWLQAALYQLALHRFLKVRLQDYDGNEAKYLGAVEFVFLRGAGLGDGLGRLVWEVPLSLVLALDKFLGGVA